MYTSLALALVVAYVPSAEPSWTANYWQARKQAQQQGKPVAVIVGSGRSGFEKLSREGQWSPAIRRTLQTSYVCVYVDTATKDGKSLAEAFAISHDVGVVLSDRTGEIQAFHHDGALAEGELVRNLEHFADPKLVVQETTTNQRVSYYPPATNGFTFTNAPAAGGRNC